MAERVVVTGLGLVTALGIGVDQNWRRLLSGVSGIRPLDLPHAATSPVGAAGQITGPDLEKMRAVLGHSDCSHDGKKILFAHWAAMSAWKDANLHRFNGKRHRWGLLGAEGIPTVRISDLGPFVTREGRLDMGRYWQSSGFPHTDGRVAEGMVPRLAHKLGLNGPNGLIMSACASGTQAIGLAFRVVRRGDAEVMVAGGTDSMIDPVGLMFFVLLTAASVSMGGRESVCRPFDRRRNGLVVGEGAGFLVLEAHSHARRRGARIYAEIAGYGSTMDAFRATAPDPKGAGAARAMGMALEDAGLAREEVDYINAHGTGTRQNDAAETLAIKRVFGSWANRLCISSSKSMIGHLMAASGAPECIYTVLTVQNNEIHPTRNLDNPDPKCDLDYVPGVKRSKTVRAALSNSFGFGGQNAAVAVRKYS
jgi:3-oxoacyl-[acyl-carrier-protein] synthase II